MSAAERKSQKGMLIGKKGAIRSGEAARKRLRPFLSAVCI